MYTILVLLFLPAVLAFSQGSLVFSVNYFKERNVRYVCVVQCQNTLWSKDFTRTASYHNIVISSFKTDNIGWRQDMERCITHTQRIGVLLHIKCNVDIEGILFNASENTWFDAEHVWLFIDNNNVTENYNISRKGSANMLSQLDEGTAAPSNNVTNDYPDIAEPFIEMMGYLNISVDADIVWAVKTGTLQYHLYDVFNFGKIQGGRLIIIDAGIWSFNFGFTVSLNGYKYYRRWNFGQWPMRIVSGATVPAKDFDPSMLSSVLPVSGVPRVTRTSTTILMVVAEMHNIKFVHSITDRWVGSFERNNTKIVGNALFYHVQDVTSVIRMAPQLVHKIGFILPSVTSLETRYYYRIPTTGPGKYENQFLRPLSVGAWWCVLAIAVLCAAILVGSAWLERRPSSVQYGLFSVIASISQQFFEDDAPTSRSSAARKLTILITGISCVLIYNYYTSSVVSWLLSGPPPSITSLEELLESPLELIYQDVGYTRSWFSNPNYYYNRRNMEIENKIRRKISTRAIDNLLKPLEEGIALVKAGGYAYHTDTDNANLLISQTFDQSELCELGSLESLEKTLLYPAVQKDSPYKEFMTWSLMRLLERGIVSCVQRRTTASSVSCEGSSPRALALGGAAPVFITLAFGFFISTLIMLIERQIYKISLRNPKRN